MDKMEDKSLRFSRIIAGCMKWGAWGSDFDREGYDRMIRGCLDLGVDTFDHADIYGGYSTEAAFGRALQAAPALRDQIRIISKCGICMVNDARPEYRVKHYDTREAHIKASVDRSLANLHTDYLDLLLIHRPDPLMDPHALGEALKGLLRAGKVRAVGVSNFSATQMDMLASVVPLAALQSELSLAHADVLFDGVLDYCQKHRIGFQSWSPLGGILSKNSQSDGRMSKIVDAVEALAEKYGATAEQVLLAWLLHHPAGIHPVIGTTKLERVGGAVRALELELTRQDWFGLLEASRGQEVP